MWVCSVFGFLSQVQETDTRSLTELYNDLAFADLESDSSYNLTEANLLKVRRPPARCGTASMAHERQPADAL